MSNNRRWLEVTESVSIAGSVIGSIAILLWQQAIYAAVPIVSFSLALNLLNRRNFEKNIKSHSVAAITQFDRDTVAIAQQIEALKIQILYLNRDLPNNINSENEFQSFISALSQIRKQQSEIEQSVEPLRAQIDILTQQFKKRPELQQIDSLTSVIIDLQQFINQLPQWSTLQQKQLVEIQQKVEIALANIPAQIETSIERRLDKIINQDKSM